MPLKNYGVLKGRPIGRRHGSGSNPHYQIHVVDDTTDYRIAVNVASQLAPSEVEYLIDSHFQHPFLAQIEAFAAGWHPLAPRKPGEPALDFIRTNLFDPKKMVPLPLNVPGPDNDLNEKLDQYVQRALADEDAALYAFGERWGPEPHIKDKIFGFDPGNGVHDIHMNQSNVGQFVQDDGVYQDGALMLHFPAQNQWVGIFLKFQSQTWHSDDTTGHQLQASPDAPDGAIRIVAALVNSVVSPEVETVTLLNVTGQSIDLAGWSLLDRDKHPMKLSGMLGAGETVRITLKPPVVLPNQGGMITLLNRDGLRVDGVTYTAALASFPGRTIKF